MSKKLNWRDHGICIAHSIFITECIIMHYYDILCVYVLLYYVCFILCIIMYDKKFQHKIE